MIELNHVTKIFNQGTVNESVLFDDFSFSVKKGEFVSIVGSNGSGKTTLLNIICGSTAVTSGNVLLDGNDITKIPEYRRSRTIDRVFQDTTLGTDPDMTIFENMCLAANKGKKFDLSFLKRNDLKELFREKLSMLGLGLEDKLETKVKFLSGGQRQAIALVMTTLSPIDILILDEHTAALDPHTAEVIMMLTDKIVKENNVTALMVTHNLRYAIEYGSRLVMMDKGNVVMDISGEEKKKTKVEDVLDVFTKISIECGN